MNERIQELALQASEQYDYHPEFAKKFAELIVKECATMCDETQADYFKHRKAADDFTDKNIYAEGEAASDVIKYKIKRHFGVE